MGAVPLLARALVWVRGSARATSSTSTKSTKAATSPPGSNRNSLPRNCGPHSEPFD